MIVAPHFRTMSEIFRQETLAELHTFAEVVWGTDGPVPQSQFDAALTTAAAVVFGTWSYGPIDRAGDRLRAVLEVAGAHTHAAIGYSQCLERGIEVGGVAPAFGKAVAELGLGLTLVATRGISRADRDFRTGTELWLHAGNVGYDTLFGKTIGFVGCGGLSVELQRLLTPFDPVLLGFDPHPPDAALAARGITPVDLEDMFDSCDVIYVLASRTEANRGMVSAELMERLGPTKTLVVLSRAWLVDFDALTELVLAGRFRAAIDVFPEEPLAADHPIRGADAAVLSAHRAGAVADALLAIGDLVVNDLRAILTGIGERRMQYVTLDNADVLIQPPPTA